MGFAGGIHIMDRSDEFVFAWVPWIGEVKATLGVEGKIIWAAERISIAFLGGMRQWFTIAVQVEDGVLACVANQMAAIG
jgi:hypothetical protein